MKTLIVNQGDTLRRRVLFRYIGTNTPVDLSGVQGFSQLRATPKGPVMAEGMVTIDATQGAVTVLYEPSQTEELEAGNYGFDIRIMSEGDVKTIYTRAVKIIDPWTELEDDNGS